MKVSGKNSTFVEILASEDGPYQMRVIPKNEQILSVTCFFFNLITLVPLYFFLNSP